MTVAAGGGRVRAYLEFLAAVVYYFLARGVAHRFALRLGSDLWQALVEQLALAFLLVATYALFGFLFDKQLKPLSEQGLPRRRGWLREAAAGAAAGWGAAVACALVLAVGGGIAMAVTTGVRAWGWLAVDVVYFAALTLAEEVAFRGYGFQAFCRSVGPVGATLGFAAFYAMVQAMVPGASVRSMAVNVVLTVVLSTAYLRTRALWVGWGLHFGWKASRALIFGLTVSGVGLHSPVLQGDPMGPYWLTGGGFGLDGSWLGLLAVAALLPVVYRLTRELDFVHNAPVIVAGGIPVDLDAAARRQHEAAMGAVEPAAPALVQIQPVVKLPESHS